MPNPLKISFLSGMFLLPLAMGCATTNSHSFVSSSRTPEISATPSMKQMLLKAEGLEKQGNKDCARLAYEDLKKAYPYSEDAKLADQRILALTSKPALMTADANLPEQKRSVELATAMTPARIVGEDASAPFLLAAKTPVAQKSPETENKFPVPDIIPVSAEVIATTENSETAPEFLSNTETEAKTASPKIVTWRESKPEFDWSSSGWKSTSQKKTQ
ncbi:MAG TPA: hypothetical protein DD473_01970 [Planctomycetaceae bacterium]|nr:hypothetical protein [Planctomycetaceae bacterium]